MMQDMQLHGLSAGTQQTYLEAIKNLAAHFNKSPDLLSEQEIRDFFLHLTQVRRLAHSTVRVYLFAARFLFLKTLGRSWPALHLIRIPHPKRLPEVLSRQEVRLLLGRVRRPAGKMSLTLMYACGLRVSEANRLLPTDIDSRRMVVRVRAGKGQRDREVPLPQKVLQQLRAYWVQDHPAGSPWLFPASDPARPLTSHSVRRCLQATARSSGITKHVSCHTLRHSYATHLLEQAVDIRVIQGLLGHRSLKSTTLYLHLTQATMKAVQATIDQVMGDL
jgi:site-specific recombinase XerD